MSLVEEITRGLMPEEKLKTVAVYAGGFKPPTKGHFEVVKIALEKNPNIDEFIILIGGKERDGVSPEESLIIWDIYKQYLPIKVKIVISPKPPIQAIYNYAKNHPKEDVIFIIGAREGNDEDFKDISNRTTSLNKYPNMRLGVIVTKGGVSGTAARNASKISQEKFRPMLPSELKDEEVEEVYNMINPVVTEELLSEMEQQELKYWALHFDIYQALTTENTPYKELLQKTTDPDRKKALDYFNHFTQTSGPLKSSLNENASYSKEINITDKIDQLTKHMISKGMNIEPLPTLEFIDGDSKNAKDFLGKTAYYNPDTQTIVLYTEGRHPKDIVRSYAHEMIHHIQNLEDRLGNIGGTNTMEDDHLNDIEAEANLKGTMTFRNWTDELTSDNVIEKKNKDPFGLNQYARELAMGLTEDNMGYNIYLDMDGVLTDFELGYEKLTGINLKGKFKKGDDFWTPISKAGVGFWAGLKWIQGGKELWAYLKPYNPVLLSAPSREESSRIGKAVWVKHKIPGTKLILRYAKQKQELATPLSILIDDRQINIDQWKDAGGIGILHTSTVDTIKQLKKLGL